MLRTLLRGHGEGRGPDLPANLRRYLRTGRNLQTPCREDRDRRRRDAERPVIPFFAAHKIGLLRVLTDRGTAYCGTVETHAYRLYPAVEGADHSKTKANSSQTNGICARLQRTIEDAFHDIALRKTLYRSVQDLKTDPGMWLTEYNKHRPHSGRYRYGKTPMQTFRETGHIAGEKTSKTPDRSDSAQTALSAAS